MKLGVQINRVILYSINWDYDHPHLSILYFINKLLRVQARIFMFTLSTNVQKMGQVKYSPNESVNELNKLFRMPCRLEVKRLQSKMMLEWQCHVRNKS